MTRECLSLDGLIATTLTFSCRRAWISPRLIGDSSIRRDALGYRLAMARITRTNFIFSFDGTFAAWQRRIVGGCGSLLFVGHGGTSGDLRSKEESFSADLLLMQA